MEGVAEKYGLRVLNTKNNPISIGEWRVSPITKEDFVAYENCYLASGKSRFFNIIASNVAVDVIDLYTYFI